MQHRTGKRGPLAQDVNTRLALGALNAGIGHTHVNSLLSCLDVPTVNHATFKTREREVGKAVELVANESCVVSCCKEREMAMAAGAECDSGNLVEVMCSMIWGGRKGERPIIRLQVMGQYLVLPRGRSWILLPGIKHAEPVLHQKRITSARHTTVGKITVDVPK